ncbi:Two-component response regulator, AmiR/NasT family, consists of REC and RNA-binding antiterminator (ANTAR) domains [Malonomonas rubra DSM 5091]|uniref:Two-component response regulator, AmiR/NasT family, consists of REC and RNA-binding antiterminator (ANTAR) domains n=1 Tax=Malonomonas rubra DSM 5091 TaxID=1122189 RepID=A0A1M6KYQ8_MALRU|nr:response regulator [Malonomonas rubra]SHJ64087.1 Two-component response regulator, AmiR/NasT family, consists of REC and RNA-binding antiterminator (ANTAR) domains [Malonomonas rubra DSM 5091]
MKPDAKLRVVIAEDEYLISQDVENKVSLAGYEPVALAANGKQALELIRKHKPDVTILDIQMPIMDGLEAARTIRDEFQIPVVLMTAYESPEFLAEAKKAGVGAYLVKPPDVYRLQRAVELAVARHDDLMEQRKLVQELRATVAKLEAAKEEIAELREIIPICSYCKDIRDDQGYWLRVEGYIEAHSNSTLSHGICPECMEKHFSKYSDRIKARLDPQKP